MKYTYLVAYTIKYSDGGMANGDIEILSKCKLNSYDKLKETRKIISDIFEEQTGKHINTVVIQNIILLKKSVGKIKFI